jgi:hypothetical protein
MRSSRTGRWTGGCALAVVAVISIACSSTKSNGNGQSGSGTNNAPQASANAAGGNPPAQSTGTVQVTFRGTNGKDRVQCSAIDTEFSVSASGGPIEWTAEARDSQPAKWPYDGNPVSSVVTQPSSGTLAEGQRMTVHVGGSHSGGRFFVAVSAPNRTGYSFQTLAFSCA